MKFATMFKLICLSIILILMGLAIGRQRDEIDVLREEIRILQTKDAEIDLNLDVVQEQLKYSPTNILKQVDEELSEKIKEIDDLLTGKEPSPVPLPVEPPVPHPGSVPQ